MKMENAIRALIACVGEENFLRELAKVEERHGLDREDCVRGVLTEMGVHRHGGGWPACVAAVELAMEHGTDGTLTKEIYPGVAKAVGTTAAGAEKRLREAVTWMWEHMADRDAAEFFPDIAADPTGRRPTVRRFLEAAADRVQQRMKNAAVG